MTVKIIFQLDQKDYEEDGHGGVTNVLTDSPQYLGFLILWKIAVSSHVVMSILL